MGNVGMTLLSLLVLIFIILLAGLIFMVTYNNGPVYLYNWKKAKYGNSIAFMFWVTMLGIAFLFWSKLFPVLTLNKDL
jgi:hypothetical protein